MRRLFVTGIGTGVGKTIASAVITEALQADYWKPVQSGDLDSSDSMTVASLISNARTRIHPEAYRLTRPMSPHRSAELDGVTIHPEKFVVPATDNPNLVIEGAGGLMVPLSDKFLILDLITLLNSEVILVSRNYLGSINHTLLSAEILLSKGIPVAGILFNGEPDGASERFIIEYTGLPVIGHIPMADRPDKKFIRSCTKLIRL